jgi:hypothetical protein
MIDEEYIYDGEGIDKKHKPKYDHFCEKTRLSNIASPELCEIISKAVLNINQIEFASYYLFCLYIKEQLDNYDPLYIYKLPRINVVTIQRSTTILLGKTLKNVDQEAINLKNIYDKYRYIFEKIKLPTVKSYNQPIEKFSEQMMVNINNHCCFNFGRFQYKYLRLKLDIHIKSFLGCDINIPYKIFGYLVRYCQSSINSNQWINIELNQEKDTKEIISKLLTVDFNSFIICEKMRIPCSLQNILNSKSDSDMTVFKGIVKDNLWDCLLYFQYMNRSLEESSNKTFDVLPHMNLGVHHVRMGSKFLSTIYNELYGNNKKIPIKTFERDYEAYYQKMFRLDYFSNRRDLNGKIPVSLITDGIAVSCMFRTERKTLPKMKIDQPANENDINNINTKTSKIKIDIEKEEIVYGLYDADNIKCSEDYLKKFQKTGIDIGNKTMFYCVSESGLTKEISKCSYYNDSHITRNKIKLEHMIDKSKCKQVYENLSKETHKSASTQKYIGYLLTIFNNWKTIWEFNSTFKQCKLRYDTYMNKKKAVKNIVRNLARRRQIQRQKKKRKKGKQKNKNKTKTKASKNKGKLAKKSDPIKCESKYYDKKIYDTIKDLPILMAIGKGNGNLTISNVKGSGPKGPIKTIIKELSKLILVVLVDEFRTSQLCSKCGEKLCHPKTKHYKNVEKNGGEIDKEGYVYESYRLCCCPNSKCHKVWNRDCNASISINKVMSLKLTGKDLGNFSRKSNVKCTHGVGLKRKKNLNKRIP